MIYTVYSDTFHCSKKINLFLTFDILEKLNSLAIAVRYKHGV